MSIIGLRRSELRGSSFRTRLGNRCRKTLRALPYAYRGRRIRQNLIHVQHIAAGKTYIVIGMNTNSLILDFAPVDHGAVGAVVGQRHAAIVFHHERGMMPAHRRLIEHDGVVRCSSNRNLFHNHLFTNQPERIFFAFTAVSFPAFSPWDSITLSRLCTPYASVPPSPPLQPLNNIFPLLVTLPSRRADLRTRNNRRHRCKQARQAAA